MNKMLALILFLTTTCFAFDFPVLPDQEMEYAILSQQEWNVIESTSKDVVISAKRIELTNYPGAFNPSILKVEEGYLFSFRYMPNHHQPWHSYIGLVILDHSFNPISPVTLLNTRIRDKRTMSQAEDARLFMFKGKIYLVYNDNMETHSPSTWERRDMYMTELYKVNGSYELGVPLKLIHTQKYSYQMWQKNWIPFESNGKLYFTYSIDPHEILNPNLSTGMCEHLLETRVNLPWNLGTPRGSTPPVLVDGEYLSFLHSGMVTTSQASGWGEMWHYFMGAYTFSPDHPFEITKMSPLPIVGNGFYLNSGCPKRVIFPGGCVVSGNKIYVAYGRDDCEMWVCTINKERLYKTMRSTK